MTPPQASEAAVHWDEQAELAITYAQTRPASDMKRVFQALRDAAEFQRLAAEARASLNQAPTP